MGLYCHSLQAVSATNFLLLDRARWDQNEQAVINAPVGRSIHWMGCVFSFDVRWGSS